MGKAIRREVRGGEGEGAERFDGVGVELDEMGDEKVVRGRGESSRWLRDGKRSERMIWTGK